MADYTSYCLQDKSQMTALGNAIRAKAGISGTLTVPEMTNAVKNIKETTTVVTNTPKVAVPTITYLTPIINEKIEPQMKISSTSSATGYAPASSIEVYTVTNTALSKTNTYNGSSQTINLLPDYGTVRNSTHTGKTMTARAICGNGMGSAMTNFYTDNQMGAIQVIHCSMTGGQDHIELAKDTGIFTGLTSLGEEAYATLYVSFTKDDNSEKFNDQELRLSRISSPEDCDMSDQVFRGEIPGYCIVELSVDLYNLSLPLEPVNPLSNILPISSISIPMPQSLIETTVPFSIFLALNSILPSCFEYFIALLIIWSNIQDIHLISVNTV